VPAPPCYARGVAPKGNKVQLLAVTGRDDALSTVIVDALLRCTDTRGTWAGQQNRLLQSRW